MRYLVRMILFVVFFAVGTAGLTVSVLCEDIVRYYRYKQIVQSAREDMKRLEMLNREYDILLENIREDPNLLGLAAAAAVGGAPNEPNVVYPKPSPEKMAQIKQMLNQIDNHEQNKHEIPVWLARVRQPLKRWFLFVASAGLILVSLVCFAGRTQLHPA